MTKNTKFTFRRNSSTVKTNNISNTNHLSASLTNIFEIVFAISPDFFASDTILTNYFEAFVTYSDTGDACSLSTYTAFASNFISSDY